MIKSEVFAQEMAVLADRIGRPLAGPTLKRYRELLSMKLTTPEFVAAMAVAFERCKFWPTVDEIVGFVKPSQSPAIVGANAFNEILAHATNVYEDRGKRFSFISSLGPAVVAAFRQVGGFPPFEQLLEAERHWLQKRFVEAFEHETTHRTAEVTAAVALSGADERLRAIVAKTADTLTTPISERRALPSTTPTPEAP